MNKANRENIDRVTIIMSYILFGESYLSLRVNDYIICQFICAICAVPPVPVHRYWYNAPYSSIMRRIDDVVLVLKTFVSYDLTNTSKSNEVV